MNISEVLRRRYPIELLLQAMLGRLCVTSNPLNVKLFIVNLIIIYNILRMILILKSVCLEKFFNVTLKIILCHTNRHKTACKGLCVQKRIKDIVISYNKFKCTFTLFCTSPVERVMYYKEDCLHSNSSASLTLKHL